MGNWDQYVNERDKSGAPLWVTDYDEYERRVAEANEAQRSEKNQSMWNYMQEGAANAAAEKKRGRSGGLAWLGLGGLAFIGPVGWMLIILGICVAVWWYGVKRREALAVRPPSEPSDNGWG